MDSGSVGLNMKEVLSGIIDYLWELASVSKAPEVKDSDKWQIER